MTAFLFILLGFTLAAIGGEAFVRGSVSLSGMLRIPSAIVGVTIAAFATSSPELSVAVNAAIAGKPGIALGDALGSNVMNITLVLGLALCFGPLPANRREVRRDWFVALLAPVLIGLFAFDGEISRTDGIILLLLFAMWLASVLSEANKSRKNTVKDEDAGNLLKPILLCIAGVGLLIGAGVPIVSGAEEIGVIFGIPPFIIGATLVAFGTSMPELATTLIAKLRGHNELGLATILGSNVFNVFVIVATAAIIHPIKVAFDSLLIVLSISLAVTFLTRPTAAGMIPRWRGYLFVTIYVAYVFLTLVQG